MGAQPWVRGPAAIFAGVGSGGAPLFLGHCERTPKIQIRPHYSPVFNDLAGQSIPFDWSFDGEEGYVVCDFTRWDQAVWAACQARPRTSAAGSVPGISQPGDIGTLMIAENFATTLWVLFPYTLKPAFALQPAGYKFFATWLQGPDDLDQNNTTAAKIRAVWYCARKPIAVGTLGLTLALYNWDMTGLPAIT